MGDRENRYYHRNKKKIAEKRNAPEAKAKRRRYDQKIWPDRRVAKNAMRRESRLMVEYGLTIGQFAQMLVAQAGRCAICRKPLDGNKEPQIDHNHETGKVRALLCGPCNVALGGFRESPTLLRAAAEYIESHEGIG